MFWWSFLWNLLSTNIVLMSGIFIVTSSNKLSPIIPCYKGISFLEKGNESSSVHSKVSEMKNQAAVVIPSSPSNQSMDVKQTMETTS